MINENYLQEEKTELFYKDSKVSVLKPSGSEDVLICLNDLCKIMDKKAFEVLKDPEIKLAIKCYEDSVKNLAEDKGNLNVLRIESSDEIYVHQLIAYQITWPGNIELHLWCQKATINYLKKSNLY